MDHLHGTTSSVVQEAPYFSQMDRLNSQCFFTCQGEDRKHDVNPLHMVNDARPPLVCGFHYLDVS